MSTATKFNGLTVVEISSTLRTIMALVTPTTTRRGGQPLCPTATAPALSLQAEALARVHALDRENDRLACEILAFRTRHSILCNAFAQIVSCQADTLGEHMAIREQWLQLHQRGGRLLRERSEALQAWAATQRTAA